MLLQRSLKEYFFFFVGGGIAWTSPKSLGRALTGKQLFGPLSTKWTLQAPSLSRRFTTEKEYQKVLGLFFGHLEKKCSTFCTYFFSRRIACVNICGKC